jgi:hypothetical protein
MEEQLINQGEFNSLKQWMLKSDKNDEDLQEEMELDSIKKMMEQALKLDESNPFDISDEDPNTIIMMDDNETKVFSKGEVKIYQKDETIHGENSGVPSRLQLPTLNKTSTGDSKTPTKAKSISIFSMDEENDEVFNCI